MKPISQIGQRSCRDLQGVAFDVDDTLTSHGRLQPEGFESLWRLHEAGLRLVAVTGRPLGWVDVMARQWPVDVAVGENGAGWVFVRDGQVREGYLSREPEVRAEEDRKLAQVMAQVQRELPHLILANDQRARRRDVAFDIRETQSVATVDLERLIQIVEQHGGTCSVSSVHAHVVMGTWDKAQGVVAAVMDALDLDVAAAPETWLFVGDSGNDAAAFSFFPLTAGVANVKEHLALLPVAPKFVSRLPRGQGFAEIVDVVLAHRKAAR